MTVSELTYRMGSRELVEWMAFYRLEPWGEDRADLRAGIVASTMANIHRGKSQKAYRPEDFMAFIEKPEPEPLGKRLRQAFKAFDAKVKSPASEQP